MRLLDPCCWRQYHLSKRRSPFIQALEDTMVMSKARTVQEYLDELTEERRQVVSAVRDVIVKNLPKGYREGINFGMICYEIPLERYPDTYNGQPLCFAALAAQKNHYAVYLSCVYQDPKQAVWLKEEFKKAGKKLDMGKSCLRFKKLEDLPLQVIGKVVKGTEPDDFVAQYEKARRK
jgi:hypothetical protein